MEHIKNIGAMIRQLQMQKQVPSPLAKRDTRGHIRMMGGGGVVDTKQ